MDDELMFKILFISIYAVFAGVRIFYRTQNIGRTGEKEVTQWTKATVALSIAILGYFVSMGLYIVVPQWIQVFRLSLPLWIRWLGVGLAVVGVALTGWIHHSLGRQYSAKLEIQEEHQLITAGPYNLFSISVSLISGNLLLILFAISVAIPFYWIARIEERMLTDQFGDEYMDYMERTGRFLPRLSKTENKATQQEVV